MSKTSLPSYRDQASVRAARGEVPARLPPRTRPPPPCRGPPPHTRPVGLTTYWIDFM